MVVVSIIQNTYQGALKQNNFVFTVVNEGQYIREAAVRELMEEFQTGM